MSPAERAAKAVMDFHARRAWGYDPVQHAELEGLIAEAIRQAVVEERERCAGIAEGERLASTEPAAKAAARLIEAVIRGPSPVVAENRLPGA